MSSPRAKGRPVVLMTSPLDPAAMDTCAQHFEILGLWEHDDREAVLDRRGDEVRAICAAGHQRVDAALMTWLPHLEIVANFGVGYESIDAAEAARRGVVVTNAAGSLDDEVADTAMALLLMTVRELSRSERYLRADRWLEAPYPLTSATVSGRTMGILGFGRIGEAIAKRAETFNVTIAYHNRRQKESPYRYYPSLLEMARDVDTLMVVLPGGAATRHVVDADVLRALGPEGVLINVGRGSVVDEQALVEALTSRTIKSAGLDVYEDEPHVPQTLMDMEHVVLLPHVGSASVPTRAAMGRLCIANLVAWFDTGAPLTPVPESLGLVAAAVPRPG